MKKQLFLFILFFSIVIFSLSMYFSAREKDGKLITDEKYDFAVYDMKNITTFKIADDKLIQIDKGTWSKSGDVQFWRDSFWSINGSFYTKTSENRKIETFLAKIDNDLTVDLVKANGNDAYTSAVDEEFFYTSACFTDRTEFYKYDKNLNLVLKKELKKQDAILTNQIVPIGDKLYVLAGYHNAENKNDKNVLLVLSKEFDVLEENILANNDSSYLRMTNYEDNLYITETNIGITNTGEPEGGNRLLVYNLKTKDESYIELTYPYPMDIYVDSILGNLIIRNYELYVSEDVWTVYSIKNKQEYFIEFSQYRTLEDNHKYAPFFIQKNGLYNFLIDETIVQFDPIQQTKNTFNLSQFKLDFPHTLIPK